MFISSKLLECTCSSTSLFLFLFVVVVVVVVAAGSHEGEQKVEGLLGMGPPASTRSERKRLQSKQVHDVFTG